MLQPTIVTWILIIFGLITCGPLLAAQMVMLLRPHGERAKELMIGKGEEWRDDSHFRSARALAWADWLFFLPVWVTGIIGVLLSQAWGYALFAAAGAIQLYTNLFLWFFERDYVYPAAGPVAYYTYIWGNFIYWGLGTVVYSALRLGEITF